MDIAIAGAVTEFQSQRNAINTSQEAEQLGTLAHELRNALTSANVALQSRDQILEIKIDPHLKFEADHQLLHSALSNLIQNALKYSRTGGKIQVQGNLVGGQIVIEVIDECGGLSNIKDLFKPFEQQHANREGMGLGLVISQRAIALNHGTIEAQNLPGKGCVFKISLPKNVEPRNIVSAA